MRDMEELMRAFDMPSWNTDEVVVSFKEFDIDSVRYFSFSLRFTGQSSFNFPDTDLGNSIKKLNKWINRKEYQDFKILIDDSLEPFFHDYGYYWNTESKRIERK